MIETDEDQAERRRGRIAVARDFINALANPFTYSLHGNPEVLFGFLWGIPIPIFAILTHAHGAGSPFDPAIWTNILQRHPVYILFFLHPILFAVVFGALGTMRANREWHIQELLAHSMETNFPTVDNPFVKNDKWRLDEERKIREHDTDCGR